MLLLTATVLPTSQVVPLVQKQPINEVALKMFVVNLQWPSDTRPQEGSAARASAQHQGHGTHVAPHFE